MAGQRRRLALAAIAICAALGAANAQQPQVDPAEPLTAAPVPPLGQRPALVVDVESGRVIHAANPHMLWHPASLTKMMTVYVALQAVRAGRVRLDQPLTVSALAARQPPSKMGFPAGSTVTLEAAIFMLMVKSANDVSVTVAEGVSGDLDSFVAQMNATARQIGMTQSVWRNPHGLPDPLQVTTARDMAVLARALYRDFPEHHRFFRAPAVQWGPATYRNYNPLIARYPGADGLKTGFICASGFNLVASASRHGRRHVAVVLGEQSARARGERAALLLERSWAAAGGAQPANWFGGGPSGPTLDSLPRPASLGAAPDLRQEICVERRGRRGAPSESEDTETPAETPVMALATPQDQANPLVNLIAPPQASAPAAAATAAGERQRLISPPPPQVSAVVLSGYVAPPARPRARRGQRRAPAGPAPLVRVAIAGTAVVGRGVALPAAAQPASAPAAATPRAPGAIRPGASAPTPAARPGAITSRRAAESARPAARRPAAQQRRGSGQRG
jgi:D-alanyl-D-alanine carboxypeptidase